MSFLPSSSLPRIAHAFTILGSFLVLTSCSNKPDETADAATANLITRQDFESLAGWNNGQDVPSLTTERAHAGKYSLKVGPGIEYSLGYIRTLGQMAPRRFRKIKISGWFLRQDQASNGTLVFSATRKGTSDNLVWAGLNIHDKVAKFGVWTQAELDVEVPANAQFDDECRVYLWRSNPAGTAVYVDDLAITIVE